MDIYLENALQCSKTTTKKYSTSFSLGVSLLSKDIRNAIYGIYGYVRFADEIVDTFHNQDQTTLLQNFRSETYEAITNKLSTNPIIHSFQWVVNTFNIDYSLIDAFLDSMAMDLNKTDYNEAEYKKYIYGSAEVVGLMCLKVFCNNNNAQYSQLVYPARKLGEAFQKVNFLRDIASDFEERGRTYFPNVDFSNFSLNDKMFIERDIENDFNDALVGLAQLPKSARFGVYLAYNYYLQLLNKIRVTKAEALFSTRIRVSNKYKLFILLRSWVMFRFRGGKIPVPKLLTTKRDAYIPCPEFA